MANQRKRIGLRNVFQWFKDRANRQLRRPSQRVQVLESLETRYLMATDWQNPFVPRDVSKDGLVVPLDALLVINELNVPTVSTPVDVQANETPTHFLSFMWVSCLVSVWFRLHGVLARY